jgi:hypothetical protein
VTKAFGATCRRRSRTTRASSVKAGEHFRLTDLRKMDWLVEGVIGQPK